MASFPVPVSGESHVTNFVQAERLSLKSDSAFDESWLESKIRENPSVLGLGALTNISNQVTQRGAGRLDLQADDVKSELRYVIELMLGELDGDHLVRIIDYWLRRSKADVDSDREVVAVLAAEKVALARYFGVVQFLAENLATAMPFIVLEMTALKVGGQTTVFFNKLIDNSLSRLVDEDEQPRVAVDRAAWSEWMSAENMALVDNIFSLMTPLDRRIEPNYQPQYIGIKIENRSKNFCYLHPRKKFIVTEIMNTKDPTAWSEKLKVAGMSSDASSEKVSVRLKPIDFEACKETLKEMLAEAYASRMQR